MAPRIVPGGRDSREHTFEFARLPHQRYPASGRPAWQRLPPADPTPTQERAAVPRMASARVRRRNLVRQPPRRHLTDAAPQWAPSPGRRPTSTSCACPATAPETATSPRCTTGPGHGLRPQPRALGRGDRLLLEQSVTRSWSSRLRRRQEDRRHQTPRRRGHAGLLVAVLVTAASVQDRAAVPRLLGRARYRCPGARPSVGRAGLHRQRRAGREQDPAVHDPDRRRDQSQGRLYHPASSLGRRADFRLDAPLPTPHPPVRADPTGP
jgi:hypothetical protein